MRDEDGREMRWTYRIRGAEMAMLELAVTLSFGLVLKKESSLTVGYITLYHSNVRFASSHCPIGDLQNQ